MGDQVQVGPELVRSNKTVSLVAGEKEGGREILEEMKLGSSSRMQ